MTFSLGFGLEKTKRVPEKSRVKSGRVDGSEAIQTARSGSYGTSDWESRSEDVCRSSWERFGSSEAPERKTRIESVLDITNPTRFGLSAAIVVCVFSATAAHVTAAQRRCVAFTLLK